MSQPPGTDRFDQDPRAYADYLLTVDGRLRLDLAWSNLREFVVRDGAAARALDVGGGPGDLAVRLARDGWDVTIVDGSSGMLDLARAAARRAGADGRVRCVHADVLTPSDELPAAAFDVVVCHNVLEYVADPDAVLMTIRRLATPSAIVSILVRNRCGEVVKAALGTGDLDAAEAAVEAESVLEPLYGEPALVFDRAALRPRLARAGLAVVAELGVRVLSDYLPRPTATASDPDAYERLLAFEQTLSAISDLTGMARYLQCIVRPGVGPAALTAPVAARAVPGRAGG